MPGCTVMGRTARLRRLKVCGGACDGLPGPISGFIAFHYRARPPADLAANDAGDCYRCRSRRAHPRFVRPHSAKAGSAPYLTSRAYSRLTAALLPKTANPDISTDSEAHMKRRKRAQDDKRRTSQGENNVAVSECNPLCRTSGILRVDSGC